MHELLVTCDEDSRIVAKKKLKYNKSPGMDNIRAEHLKNGPIEELSK